MESIKFFNFSLLLVLLGLCGASGEKLDRLENLISSLSNKFGDFVTAVDKITHMLTRMEERITLNELIDKCTGYIRDGNEVGVIKTWAQIIKNHNKTTSILNQIIIDAYAGKRENILGLIRFLAKTNRCSGYETLFREMQDYGHFYGGTEIFSLAYSILNNCNATLFEKLPRVVQLVYKRNVTLQSTFTKGYLYRKLHVRDQGLENHIATIKNPNTTDIWSFSPATDYAENFYIRHGKSYLVATTSRRLYFTATKVGKFYLEMTKNQELSIGVELDVPGGGRKFYRLYVQKHKLRKGDVHEVNLWTINPTDQYDYHWIVQPDEQN